MIVVGLTGSIGMGKSTVARYLRSKGIPILDADVIVHELYAGEAAPLIEAAFPGTVKDGVVDRKALSAKVVGSEEAMKQLEAIVHPLVRRAELRYLMAERDKGAETVVVEVPLLFETDAQEFFDAVIVVSAPPAVQHERVVSRPGMTDEKFHAILSRQWPDAKKREIADFVVDTGVPYEGTYRQIDAVVEEIGKRTPHAYHRWAEVYSAS
jgi:dephospho-CoA kinase